MASRSCYLTPGQKRVMVGLRVSYNDGSIGLYRHIENANGGVRQEEIIDLTHEETVALKRELNKEHDID